MAAGNTRTVITALIANIGLAVAKFVGFIITGSSAMLSESVHSVAGASNQLLLLIGGRQAQRRAAHDQPFGYGRERYFWSFVVAIILYSLGGLFSLYEGKHKIDNPTELESPGVALAILVVGFGLAGYAFTTAKTEADRMRGRNSWGSFIRRARSPEVPVVLIQDGAVLVGLTLAFLGVILAEFVNPTFDGVASILIGVLLLGIAIVMAVEMKSLLIGESASPENRDRLVAAVEGHRDVVKLIDMRTQHLGPDEILVGAKVHYREDLTMPQLAQVINETELGMRTALDERLTIYLEPDLFDADVHSAELATESPDAFDPFENYVPTGENADFAPVNREDHDDRNPSDERDTRREQAEPVANDEAITTPSADDDTTVDLDEIDRAARASTSGARSAKTDKPAVPLPTPGDNSADEGSDVADDDVEAGGEPDTDDAAQADKPTKSSRKQRRNKRSKRAKNTKNDEPQASDDDDAAAGGNEDTKNDDEEDT